jgi:GAF domain-containing protein
MLRDVEAGAIVEAVLADLGASRVTLRQRSDGSRDAGFPITHEALAPGAPSLRGVETPSMARQPVVLRVLRGEQVVQDDCAAEFEDDEPFHRMLALYGGMRAQIVTPAVVGGETVAILSVHELRRTRHWSEAEVARCRAAAEAVGQLLSTTQAGADAADG